MAKVDVQRKAVKPGSNSGRPTRGRLNRDLVLQAALTIADEEGVEGLSMRRLAQQLGVEAMSLYHWFPSKDSLLTAMLDAVYEQVELPPAGAAWRPALRQTAVSAYRSLLKHGWAAALMDSLSHISVPRLRWMDSVLGVLRDAGFSPELIDLSYHVLDSHITGFVLWVLPFRKVQREQPNFAEEFQKNYPLGDMPDLADHVAYHLAPPRDGALNPFEFGLDLILDGLERKLATRRY